MTAPQFYAAGPYTSADGTVTRRNIQVALDAGAAICRVRGWFPIVPHASGSHRVTWEEAMVRCRSIIGGLDPAKDILVLLPEWESSRGTREEKALAESLGIRVVTLAEALSV